MLVINEDLLGPEAIADPYTYYGRLREEDPIHWNPLYETWVGYPLKVGHLMSSTT